MTTHTDPQTAQRPWLGLYPAGVDQDPVLPAQSMAHAWHDRVDAAPHRTAFSYQGRQLTAAEVDAEAAALSNALLDHGLDAGSVLGVYLQNVPQFAITLLAAWRIGVIPLVLNPMYRGRELRALIDDSQAAAIVADSADAAALTSTLGGSSVGWILTTHDAEYAPSAAPAPAGATGPETAGDGERREAPVVEHWAEVLAAHRGQAGPADDRLPGLDDPALLAYTSGTTGPAKGSVATHRNVLTVAQGYGQWLGLTEQDVMLAVAPLFHITGAVACAATSLVFPITLAFVGRVDAEKIVRAMREDAVTVTIGSITVYNALLEHPTASAEDLRTVRYLYSGGAPVPPATVARFRERYGHYIHNVYGMTETASAVIGVPPGTDAPVDPSTETLAIGVPFPGLSARIVDPATGRTLTEGTAGELQLRGDQITPGYRGKPEANEAAFDDGWLRTGDVAVMDANGWIYLVDRIKDQINASGYKVWPREVEDVLYEHPAVLEAAVVGEPDPYRGETVVAYVSLRAGAEVTEADLIAFTRERLAAYKYPRTINIIDDLPKTHTGKIQRRLLRAAGKETA